jgi:hypothetical protein
MGGWGHECGVGYCFMTRKLNQVVDVTHDPVIHGLRDELRNKLFKDMRQASARMYAFGPAVGGYLQCVAQNAAQTFIDTCSDTMNLGHLSHSMWLGRLPAWKCHAKRLLSSTRPPSKCQRVCWSPQLKWLVGA